MYFVRDNFWFTSFCFSSHHNTTQDKTTTALKFIQSTKHIKSTNQPTNQRTIDNIVRSCWICKLDQANTRGEELGWKIIEYDFSWKSNSIKFDFLNEIIKFFQFVEMWFLSLWIVYILIPAIQRNTINNKLELSFLVN